MVLINDVVIIHDCLFMTLRDAVSFCILHIIKTDYIRYRCNFFGKEKYIDYKTALEKNKELKLYSFDNSVRRNLMIDYINRCIWKPATHILFPKYMKKIIFTLYCINKYSRPKKRTLMITLPKPVLAIIINKMFT